jgi:beta-lactamase class A
LKANMKQISLNDAQKKWLIVGGVITLTVIIIGQLLYPREQLVPFASIDGFSVGGWQKKDATWELDQRLTSQEIPIKIKQTGQTYQTVKPSDIGLTIDNQVRVEAASYPLWARMIPSSLLWYQSLMPQSQPEYVFDDAKLESFMKQTLGDCKLQPKNADIVYKDNKLTLVPASAGGECDRDEVMKVLKAITPTLQQPSKVTIEGSITKPNITDEVANKLIESLAAHTKNGVSIEVNDKEQTIPQKDILSWLEFKPEKTNFKITINDKKSDKYFAAEFASAVAQPAGTSHVTTHDFTVISKKEGRSGRALDNDATRASILEVINNDKYTAMALTKVVKPKINYDRTYSRTSVGMTAFLTHYAEGHPGEFGVSFIELEGAGRSAQYGQDKVFTTASTYKLFVAFSTLKRIDNGSYEWSDSVVDGRNLKTCFDDMIVKSDNPCAEALIKKIGRDKLDSDLRSIGLTKSTFRAKNNQTTSAELAVFLTKLEKKKLPLKSASRDTLLGAMKRQVYRQGIPAGTSGEVADKVGFLNGLLHDAAIVYSPKGTYVLVILSDNSTWASIADITRRIEALR